MEDLIQWAALEKRQLEGWAAQRTLLQTQLREEEAKLTAIQQRWEAATQALQILQSLSQSIQEQVHQRIVEVVSACLEAVFEEPYTFKIRFEKKRGRTEARLLFVRGDLELDPLTASGGGVVDVAAFALRVAALSLHRPPLSRILVLDEPFRFVSEQYQPRIRAMLEEVSQKTGMQVVMVTHNPIYATGVVLNLEEE
jgi:DNA repair exonuclease SbcCD ATPase subunit